MNYTTSCIFAGIIMSFLSGTISNACDNAHFYRATYFGPEPRLTYPWLTSLEGSIARGYTSHSLNGCGTTVPLFDLYGVQNMQVLGKEVPNKDMINMQDLIITLLEELPSNGNFGHVSIPGTFEIVEGILLATQNLTCGFFLQVHAPIRNVHLQPSGFNDLSPDTPLIPNKNTPVWQSFLLQFDQILQRYNLSPQPIHKTGFGDTTALVGWSVNYEDTRWCDYIDATIKTGILFPTGAKRNENKIFDIALGYNGHLGLPVSLAGSIGIYEWLTLGGYAEAIFFGARTAQVRMKTAFEQSGLIKLAQGVATSHAGTVWLTGGYVKADHFCRGLSIIIGYSYAQKSNDILTPTNQVLFNATIVNSDQQLASWNRHTLHALAEFDLTQEDNWWGVRLGIFYNRSLGGRHIFKTSMLGAYTGLEVACSF
jgi:hypothetical protein